MSKPYFQHTFHMLLLAPSQQSSHILPSSHRLTQASGRPVYRYGSLRGVRQRVRTAVSCQGKEVKVCKYESWGTSYQRGTTMLLDNSVSMTSAERIGPISRLTVTKGHDKSPI
eukprot:4122506-Pyramimonas_sp.AAC.1